MTGFVATRPNCINSVVTAQSMHMHVRKTMSGVIKKTPVHTMYTTDRIVICCRATDYAMLRCFFFVFFVRHCVIHCMVCASVREDNTRALASVLLPVQTHKLYNNMLIAPAYICT